MDEFSDGSEVAFRIRSGDVSVAEVLEASVERAKATNPALNAIIFERYEEAIEQARKGRFATDGPFAGVPYVVKDMSASEEGEPYCEGNKRLKELGYRALETSSVVKKARAAGLISIGRTATPEFAAGNCPATAETDAFGATSNPWDTSRTAMGSSSGSAACVASGIVPVALGTDGGGSIRLPASACGLVGMKPTRGRVSVGPTVGESWNGMATYGALTRTMRDCAAMLDALSGMMPGDHYGAPTPERPYVQEIVRSAPPMKIGVIRNAPIGAMSEDVQSVIEDCRITLEKLGHTVVESHPEGIDDVDAWLPHWRAIVATEVRARIEAFRSVLGRDWTEDDMEFGTWAVYEAGKNTMASEYYAARVAMNNLSRRVAKWWHCSESQFDLLLTPTMNEPAPKLGHLVELVPERSDRLWGLIPYTALFNMTGQPAISLPVGMSKDSLPIGVHLVAAFGREDLLIRLGADLERVYEWHTRRPPVWAL